MLLGRKSIINNLEEAIKLRKETENMHNDLMNKSESNSDELQPFDKDNIDPYLDSRDIKVNKFNSSSESIKSSKSIKVEDQGIPICKLLAHRQFVFAMMSGSLGYFIGSFAEPILALQLKQTYHFKDSVISLFFVIHFMGYLIFSPLVQYIPKRFDKRLIMMTGSFMAFVTLIFYGPSKMMGFPQDWHLMLIGLVLMGCSITF